MPLTNGFSAWVTMDGVKLPQYGAEIKVNKGGEGVVGCWIESRPGKAFEVGYSIPAYSETLVGEVYVSGVLIGGFIHVSDKSATVIQSSKSISGAAAQPLVFSKIEFTDKNGRMNIDKNLGEIAVDIWATADPQLMLGCSPNEQLTKIRERVKQASVSYQAIVDGESTVAVPTEFLTEIESKRDVMTFYLDYRSRDYLQAKGIIPLDPKPDGARSRKRVAETLEPCTSGDERETRDEELRSRQEGLQTQKDKLEIQKRELQIRREELQIRKEEVQMQKEELRIQNEELRIRVEERELQLDTVKAKGRTQSEAPKLDAVKAEAKRQRKEPKLESREAKSRGKAKTVDHT